jgi:hypothetical protein
MMSSPRHCEHVNLDLHSGLVDLINELPLTGKYRPLNRLRNRSRDRQGAFCRYISELLKRRATLPLARHT